MSVLVILASLTAVLAAIRSTWSPCGQSMLSSITPLSERSRGHRFGVTATWFVVGAVVGGATFGLGLAAIAGLVAATLDPAPGLALGLAAAAAAVAGASDSRVLGRSLPFHCRQVNELWLNRYRRWVYAAGFGWQIGTGLSTFVLTAGVYLLVVLAGLTADPVVALGLGVGFGLVRGLGILPAHRITTPAALGAFHRRFDALGPVTRRAMAAAEFGIAAVAGAAAFGASTASLGGLGAVAVVVTALTFARRPVAGAVPTTPIPTAPVPAPERSS